MNASASVFHWHGSVRVADRQEPNKHAAKTLHIVRKALQPNPFGLTKCQADSLDALLKCSTQKEAAALLGVAPRTLECHIRLAKLRMGVSGHYRHLLMWQEFRSHSPL